MAALFPKKVLVGSLALAVAWLSGQTAPAQTLTWVNAGPTNNWSTTTTDANWDSDGNGTADTFWTTGSDAVFGATPETGVTPTTAVIVDDMTFNGSWSIGNGAASSINLTTDGNSDITVGTGFTTTIGEVLSGTNALTKLGAGTLTLSTGNTYSGITTIDGGTISIAADNRLGAAPSAAVANQLTLNGGTLRVTADGVALVANRGVTLGANGGTFDITTSGNSTTLNGAITGTGDLIKSGAGRLVLANAASDFTGLISLGGGIVNVNLGDGVLGSVANDITFTANATLQKTGLTDVILNSGRTITINSGVTATFDHAVGGAGTGAFTVNGNVEGGGNLTKVGAQTLTLAGANTYTGTTTLSAGTLGLSSSGALGTTGNIVFGGGTLQYSASNTTDYSSRIASGTSTSAIRIDTNGQIVTFASNLTASQSSGLIKSGAGTLILSGANAYSGNTSVTAGTLQLQANAGNNVGSTATVIGSGTLSSISNGATIQLRGDTSGTMFAGFGSNVTTGTVLANSGLIAFDVDRVSSGSNATLNIGGLSTQNSTINVTGGNGYALSVNGVTENLASNGAAHTTTFNPTTANLSLGNLATINGTAGTSTMNWVLDGTSTGNGVTGVINNGQSNTRVTSVTKSNTSTWTLSATNTFQGATTVNGGTLKLAAAGALGGSGNSTTGNGDITVNNGGTLLLAPLSSGSTTSRINDAATVTLAGGTITTGGLQEGSATIVGLGALTLTANSYLNFSDETTSGLLHFAASNGTWNSGTTNYTLSIYNWDAGQDRLFFGTDSNGLSSSQLTSIRFYEGEGTGELLGTAQIGADGEVTLAAVPEPSTVFAGIALVGLVGYRERRRFRQAL